MATTDLERLVVSLEANIRGYERNMQRALGVANSRTRQIENRFARMNRTIDAQFRKLGGVVGSAFTIHGAQQLIDASTRITNALRVAGLEGDALTRVYDRLFEAAQKNAAPLESLVTLYGRAAIVQKELGVSTEELLNFTNNVALALRVAGTDAQSASGALLQLSQALGSGVVRAEEFNSILEGALPIAQAAAAGLEEAGGSVAKLRGLIIEGRVSSEAFFRAFEAGSAILEDKVAGSQITVSQGFTRIYNAAIDAAGKINEGAQAGDQLAKSLNGLAEAIQSADFSPLVSGLSAAIEYARTLGEWLDSIAATVNSAGTWFGDQIGTTTFGRAIAESMQPYAPSAGGPSTRGGPRGSSGRTASTPTVSLGDFAPPSSSDGGRSREDAWARETRQIQEATAALQQELMLIGQTEFARDKARAALELENAARRAGITDIEAHRTKIDELATAYATAAENVRQAEDRFEAITELQREFGQLAIDGITGLIDGTRTLNDVLADTLKRLGELALQAAILGEGPFATLFGGKSSNGGVGGLVGAIGSLFGGFFANGGTLGAGKWGIAGETGPEIIKGPAQVIPNTALRRAQGSSAPTVNVSIDARGADPTSVARLQAMRGQIVREAVQAAVAAVPKTAGNRPSYYGSGR